ncbi:MAG TPA: M48 family metalloprotease [Bryobacteraceae bacterium]|nr:M48 family metalloprotease [Bryobacteraceae bacterium]
MVRYIYMRRVCAIAVFLPLAFAQNPKNDPNQIGARDVSKGVNWYSIQKEMALGKQLAQEVEKTHKVVTDMGVTEYVNRVGQNLAAHSDTRIPVTIKVIEGDEPNAITLPGGYIYVQTGLIRTADTEAQLAAAIAHEIAHVAARHGTRQATHEQVGQLATIPLIFLPLGGLCGLGANHVLLPAGLLAEQRGYEKEADMLGLQYLYKTGYDPLGMVEIFERIFSLDDRKQGKVGRVFSTHPDGDQRLIAVQKNIESQLAEQEQYVVTTSDFNKMQARLTALDWEKKPEPVGPKPPTLHKSGDDAATAKKLVPQSTARASQIKEAYNIR